MSNTTIGTRAALYVSHIEANEFGWMVKCSIAVPSFQGEGHYYYDGAVAELERTYYWIFKEVPGELPSEYPDLIFLLTNKGRFTMATAR